MNVSWVFLSYRLAAQGVFARTAACALLFFVAVTVTAFSYTTAPADAQGGAALRLFPASGTFYVRSTFDVSIILDTGSQSVNAVAAELRFPPDILQVVNPAAGSSIVTLWSSPPSFSNEEGIVRLQGGIPSPGVKTAQGVVTTLTFRAMRPGTPTLVFTSGSKVLANDGRGTNILSQALGATYRIDLPPPEGPLVNSPTHPDQSRWYRSRTPTLQWIVEEGATDFAWSLDQDAGGTVRVEDPRGLASATSFENLADGLWYFHIRAKKGTTWGGVTTFLIRIDQTPPAKFQLEFAPRDVTSERRPFVNFVTTDSLSGVNRYELKLIPTKGGDVSAAGIGTPFFVDAQSPYRLSELSPGGYDIIVRAYDNADNSQEAIGHLAIIRGAIAAVSSGLYFGSWFFPWWLLTFIGLLAFGGGAWLFRYQRMRHHGIRRRLDEDVSRMRDRLRRDFSEISERVAHEEHLKQKLAEQLQRLDAVDKKHAQQGSTTVWMPLAMAMMVAVSSGFLFLCKDANVLGTSIVAHAQETPTIPRDSGLPIIVLTPPLVTTFRGQIGSDELLYIGGIAPSDSIVLVSLAQEQQESFVVETRADREGRWSYLHPRFLQPGVYKVFARTRDDAGNVSEWGSQVTIEVVSRTLSLGGLVLPYQAVLGIANVLLILIASVLGGAALWFNRRSHTLRQRLAREVHEAEAAVQEGFRLLRQDVEKELEIVKAAAFSSRKVSKEEKELQEKLILDLQAIEDRVRKEVEDIERAL